MGGVMGLIGLFVFFLAISWRKWPDPLIDFGRELYLPWRLSQGAVLYRDVDDMYGPLSQYFNSALFTCFGPGLMILAMANILIFIGILTITYFLCRRAWGAGAALAATAVFIVVFGFSELGDLGNFNYATPYSHETTHGLLVCLVLVIVLLRWIQNGTLAGSFLAGLLFGLTMVLKAEVMLSGAVLIFGAAWAKYRSGTPLQAREIGLMACGAVLPPTLFFAYFSVFMPWPEALSDSIRTWVNATNSTFLHNHLEVAFIGMDQPWPHFWRQFVATLGAALFIALIALAGWLLERIGPRWLYLIAVGLAAAGLSWLSIHLVDWPNTGSCLPGLMGIYLVICLTCTFGGRGKNRQVQLTRLLMALLASAFLFRMLLYARLFGYGYYQAALAAILVPAILIGELPDWLGVGRRGRSAIVIGTLALLLPGVTILAWVSHLHLSRKTYPVGTGADRFYAVPPGIDPTGDLVNSVSAALRKGPRETLLVLPEGVMINYLARLPSTVSPYYYYAMETADGGESRIVEALQNNPPDCVVIISRPLVEWGIKRWGREPEEGEQILAWVLKNYDLEESKGGNPLDIHQRGVVILTRKPGFP